MYSLMRCGRVVWVTKVVWGIEDIYRLLTLNFINDQTFFLYQPQKNCSPNQDKLLNFKLYDIRIHKFQNLESVPQN